MNVMKLGLFAALCAVSVSALAQDSAPKGTLKLDKPSGVAGAVLKGTITLTFAEGLHAYQNPPTESFQIPVTVAAAKGTTLAKTTYPKGVPFLMAGEEKPSLVYQGTVTIPVELKLATKAGKQTIKLSVDYQQCNDSSCYPPGKLELSTTVNVTAAPKKKG